MRGGIDRALMHDAVAILNRVQRYKKYLEYANFQGRKYKKKAKGIIKAKGVIKAKGEGVRGEGLGAKGRKEKKQGGQFNCPENYQEREGRMLSGKINEAKGKSKASMRVNIG